MQTDEMLECCYAEGMQHVFIIGSRGLPAQYGGFETFVENLILHQNNKDILYHVACLSDTEHHTHKDFHGADCFTINPPKIGPARVIMYDTLALEYALSLVKKNSIKHPVFCILGNTIGPLIARYAKKIHKTGGRLLVNPDGLEFKRSKWTKPVRAYLKYAEKCMARHADVIVSDNIGIQEYMQHSYPGVNSTFIAYGTETHPTHLTGKSEEVRAWFEKNDLKEDEYYLIVGRFVPENNYEAMIREFMQSSTQKQLVIICNSDGNSYFDTLKERTHFDTDPRIKFVGTVYNKELLTYIRQNAFAYIHGHSVGGTNPGLLEALSYTKLNLILNVSFNHSVAKDSVLYWKIDGMEDADSTAQDCLHLHNVINRADAMTLDERAVYGVAAKQIIAQEYTWDKIVGEYEELFNSES
ncbi:beta 1-4 rhamnosyltransferase Cps2T [Alloscardovia omnicolens]|uniref:beta 1-4 rhamnosyltransferase Cps2T n=1 Tax=Alloscardovia omnicolens TaxID=419015 RepID=UPI003A69DB63